MKRRVFSHHLLAAGLVVLQPSISQADDMPKRRRLRFTITFSNPTNRKLDKQQFWCYLPANATYTQRLIGVEVSMAHQITSDVYGHSILELTFDEFPAFSQKIVSVTTEVEYKTKATTQEPVDLNVWLMPERFIESDHESIRALASSLQKSAKIKTVQSIFEWVRDNITYAGYIPEDLGALQALQHRRGDCTEYADLVVALARASGLAARMVGGYVVDHDVAPRPQDYHNWAEIYLDDSWRVVDSQKGSWMESKSQYIVFRIYRDLPTNLVEQAHRYRLKGDLQITF
jgi:transglutaminase/protease-like cytokinesis protein 3